MVEQSRNRIRIRGGKPLFGEVQVSGSKNAALPIIISSLLAEGTCHFTRVPNLVDVRTILGALAHLGVQTDSKLDQNRVSLNADSIHSFEAPYDLVKTMRASVVVLGPLLARYGKAKVSLPGGCAIGARPINYHLAGLERLGAEIQLENGYVIASAKRLRGNRVTFEFPSVGATQNLMMAAVLAEGETLLENCAQEPEIIDLASALKKMGAVIEGAGTGAIQIQGKTNLNGCNHEIMGDRIEAGTFLAAGLATGGRIRVNGISSECLDSLLVKLESAGALLEIDSNSVTISRRKRPLGTDITTLPYPGFATDMQAQFMAVMTIAEGASVITETVFENRFMHVSELSRLGADITIRGNSALVRGKAKLKGAPLMATDLRASASLIIGGLCAEGETSLSRIYHLDRGYEMMEEKLRSLGADITRIS